VYTSWVWHSVGNSEVAKEGGSCPLALDLWPQDLFCSYCFVYDFMSLSLPC